MLIVHYGHRLPGDYDLESIRRRTQERGRVWDDVPDLYFKAFLLRENGRFSAAANHFSSLYLWGHEVAFRDWLARGGYEIVTDAFGRAEIDATLTLDARRGPGREARFLYREDLGIPVDADLTAALSAEIDRNRDIATRSGIVVAAVGLDVRHWRVSRILLSEDEPAGSGEGAAYQILHLSRPLLDTLPPAGTR